MYEILIQILIYIYLYSIWVPSRTMNMLFKSPWRISFSFVKQKQQENWH